MGSDITDDVLGIDPPKTLTPPMPASVPTKRSAGTQALKNDQIKRRRRASSRAKSQVATPGATVNTVRPGLKGVMG